MNDKMLTDLKKLSFLGFIIVADTAIRFDHISAVSVDDENLLKLRLMNGEVLRLDNTNSIIFLDQVHQIVAAVQLAQARAQSNILV